MAEKFDQPTAIQFKFSHYGKCTSLALPTRR